jgi:four helix bundle protein
MPIYSYRDLEVYGEAFELALKVHRRSEDFPSAECYGMTSQVRRSSKSICALIAEGFGRKDTVVEFKRYLRMAHGSVQETKVWLEFAEALGFLAEGAYRELWEGYDRLGKRIYRMIATWDKVGSQAGTR